MGKDWRHGRNSNREFRKSENEHRCKCGRKWGCYDCSKFRLKDKRLAQCDEQMKEEKE